MCIISIDRYCAVLHPLGPRITESVPLLLVLLIIWLLSCALSVPFAYYNQVSEIDLVVRQVVRCRANFPSAQYDKMLTILAVSTQYAIPLAIASIAYCSIAFHIKQRSKLGSMTQNQLERISKYDYPRLSSELSNHCQVVVIFQLFYYLLYILVMFFSTQD